jgi:type 1 fimbriae regulatory protein FimB/type 1 fimbriae regulatory protein FimE
MNPPKRIKNNFCRARKYLTPTEINRLMAAAKRTGRHEQSDATMILLAYRHGLRVSELISLCWSQLDLDQGLFYVIRRKNGLSTHHPLFGAELRALRQLKRDYPDTDYVFMTERKAPITGNTVLKFMRFRARISYREKRR